MEAAAVPSRLEGAVTAFGFAPDRQALVFAVTHEGVVAVLRLTGGIWVPAVEFLNVRRSVLGPDLTE